ncbi:MAG: 2-keto-4-pentenoate hydratase [Caldisphaera sp.]|uniref:2-keto-4-pentenoate hydratase n=1 Tax=Caldisphaera sp. TaxID=2060322 RepID=UPI003D0F1423
MDLKTIANQLLIAKKDKKPVDTLTETYPGFNVELAYQVQLLQIEEEVKLGKKIIGKKIGLTSKPMQELLGVTEPDYGHLMSDMYIADSNIVKLDNLIQPKVEGEIAFVLNRDLEGPNVTITDVYRATEGIMPAIEIIDSRIKNWKIKLPDTVADNASSALFVVGARLVSIRELDIKHIGMVIEKNGEVVGTGAGAAVLGHPANAVAWLANKLSEFGVRLKEGEIILSGALSAAVNIEKNTTFRISLYKLGDVSISFI